MTVDQVKPGEFMHRMIGFMAGSAVWYGIWLVTDRLYRVLVEKAPSGCGADRGHTEAV